jgi:hypothetical protein
LICHVALFVGTDEPTGTCSGTRVPRLMTGVIVPATIWSNRCPESLYGMYMLNAPPAVRVVAFVSDCGANVVPAARPIGST